MAGVGCDVGIDHRRMTRREAPRPPQVIAAGIERVAWKVEVVFVEPACEIVRGRPDLDEVSSTPRPPQRDRRFVEKEIDVHRQVGIARTTLPGRIDDPNHRSKALGEGNLVVDAGESGCRPSEGRDSKRGEKKPTPRGDHGPILSPG